MEKAIAVASLGIGPTYGAGGLNVLGFAVPPEPTVVIVPDRSPAPDEWTKDGKERLLDIHDAAYRRAVDRLILADRSVLLAAAPDCQHKACKDSDAYLVAHGPIRLADLIERATPATLSDDGWRKRLAGMSGPEYDRARKKIAAELGIRVSTLDGMRKTGMPGAEDGEEMAAAQDAVAVAVNSGAAFWRDDGDDAFATFQAQGGACISAKIPSLRLEDWIRDIYGTAHERTVGGAVVPGVLHSAAFEEAWKTLRSMARRGEVHKPQTRVGHADGTLYLDLADRDSDRPFVEVRRTGEIELVAAPAARMVHMSKALPLPVPVVPVDPTAVWAEFDRLVGIDGKPGARALLRGFQFSTLFQGPHVGLADLGDPGAGKTTRGRVIKGNIDPAKAGARLRPRTIEDFIIGA